MVVSGSLDLFSNAFFTASAATGLGRKCAGALPGIHATMRRTLRSSAWLPPAGPLSKAVQHECSRRAHHQSLVPGHLHEATCHG